MRSLVNYRSQPEAGLRPAMFQVQQLPVFSSMVM